MGHRRGGVALDRFGVILQRAVVLLLAGKDRAAIVEDRGEVPPGIRFRGEGAVAGSKSGIVGRTIGALDKVRIGRERSAGFERRQSVVDRLLDRVVGVERQRLVEIGLRGGAVALEHVGLAASGVGQGIVGVDLDRFGEFGDGLLVILLVAIDIAASDVTAGNLGIEVDGLGVVGEGPVVVLLHLIGVAAVEIGIGIVGVERDRLGVIGNGAIGVPVQQQGVSAVEIGHGI